MTDTAPPTPGAYSSFTTLQVERRDPVGWLIFDRPDQLDAMDFTMRDGLAVAWRELDADPEVKVIVHTGNGWAFQTGVDVRQIASDGVGGGLPPVDGGRWRASTSTSRRGTSGWPSRAAYELGETAGHQHQHQDLSAEPLRAGTGWHKWWRTSHRSER